MAYYSDILSSDEVNIIRECLYLSDIESVFPNWEFDTLFGIDRNTFRGIVKAWPDVKTCDKISSYAIINSMNNIIGYPWNASDIKKSINQNAINAIMYKINNINN